MKKCPFCAEDIQDAAKVCKHCGRDLVSQDTAQQVVVVQPKQKTGCVTWLVLIFFGLVFLGWCGSLISPNKPSAPTTSTPNTPSSGSVPAAAAPESNLTRAQRNAARSARSYLAVSGFSRRGLIAQLSSEHGDKFSVEDSAAAVDSLDVDWNAQAVRSAAAYLKISGFSCQGLIQQLSSEHGDKYTVEQATYGAAQAGIC
jgi:hypothetical protein